MRPEIERMRASGPSLTIIPDRLDAMQVPTSRSNGRWTATASHNPGEAGQWEDKHMQDVESLVAEFVTNVDQIASTLIEVF
jgi:hypothetical protein